MQRRNSLLHLLFLPAATVGLLACSAQSEETVAPASFSLANGQTKEPAAPLASLPEAASHREEASFIVEGRTTVDQATDAVLRVGGKITHDLRIIQAVAATLTPEQLRSLKADPTIRRVTKDAKTRTLSSHTRFRSGTVLDTFDGGLASDDGSLPWSGGWTLTESWPAPDHRNVRTSRVPSTGTRGS